MTWIRENPFVTGLVLLTIIAVGALGYFLNQSMGRYQEVADGYTQAVAKLHGLQNRNPFPSEENFAKTRVLAEEYQAELRNFRARLAKLQVPIDPAMTARQFQDNLRVAVNETVQKAGEAGVTLPDRFYLGFAEYKDSPPGERAAPGLARQLVIIRKMVDELIQLKVKSIDTLDRRPLPEEGASPSAQIARNVIERNIIDLAFTSGQTNFLLALNSFLSAEQFLIVRSVTVQNSNPVGPPVLAAVSAAEPPPGMPAEPESTSNLNVVFGRELVKVTLRVEIINFNEPK